MSGISQDVDFLVHGGLFDFWDSALYECSVGASRCQHESLRNSLFKLRLNCANVAVSMRFRTAGDFSKHQSHDRGQ